jgi:hypothetical protein
LGRRSLGRGSNSQMKTLGMGVLMAMVAGATGIAMLGWAYEGPKRFIRRVKLRKALR